jgi:hypothetical protein
MYFEKHYMNPETRLPKIIHPCPHSAGVYEMSRRVAARKLRFTG